MSDEPVAEAPKPPPLAPAPAPKLITVNIRDRRQRCIVCGESLDRGALIQFTKKRKERPLWVTALTRNQGEFVRLLRKLENTRQSYQLLCRLHFKPEDFSTNGNNRLLKGRIPSRLVWKPTPVTVARPFSNRMDKNGNPVGLLPPISQKECNAVELMGTAHSVKEEVPDPEETAAAGPENGRMEAKPGWQSPGGSMDSFASDLDSFGQKSPENMPETGYMPEISGRQAALLRYSPETAGHHAALLRDSPAASGRQAALLRDPPATSGNPEKRTFFMIEDHCVKELLKTCPQCAAECQVTMFQMGTGLRATRICPNGDVIPPWFSSRSVVVKQKEDIKMET